MTAHGTSTINQLVDLFHQSRNRGERVTLSMESKDGKDSLTFTIGNSTGSPAESPRPWTPCSYRPWAPCPGQPWATPPKRRKTPSQWKRDQKRKQDFLAKKRTASLDIKKEGIEPSEKATTEVPEDEINLSHISSENENENETDLFKVVGKYKNPKFQPWSMVEPDKEVKHLWEALKEDNEKKGIEEIGEGSTCFEHYFEFWGTWKVKKKEIKSDFLKNSVNWPRGIEILEVKPA